MIPPRLTSPFWLPESLRALETQLDKNAFT
jgi:hypothetical protein